MSLMIKDVVHHRKPVIPHGNQRPPGSQTGNYLRVLYVMAMILWLIIIGCFHLGDTTAIGWFILIIPFIVFIVGYLTAPLITKEVEDSVFQANFLAIGLIIILPLLTWVNKGYNGDHEQFTAILILAVVLIMFSI